MSEYKILQEGEKIKSGDEYHSFGEWREVPAQWDETTVSYNEDNTFSRMRIKVRRKLNHCVECDNLQDDLTCNDRCKNNAKP